MSVHQMSQEQMALLQWLISSGVDPSILAGGAFDDAPYNLNTNYLVAGLAGPGAWGADAFQPSAPTREYIDTPGFAMLADYLGAPPDTLEYMIAEGVAANTPASAIRAQIIDIIEQPDEVVAVDPVQQALRDSLRRQVGIKRPADDENPAVYDTDYLRKLVDDLVTTYRSDRQSTLGSQQDEAGRFYRETPGEASPASKWFAERGLPTPDQRYSAEMLLGQDWAAAGPVNPDDYRAMMDQMLGVNDLRSAYEALLEPPSSMDGGMSRADARLQRQAEQQQQGGRWQGRQRQQDARSQQTVDGLRSYQAAQRSSQAAQSADETALLQEYPSLGYPTATPYPEIPSFGVPTGSTPTPSIGTLPPSPTPPRPAVWGSTPRADFPDQTPEQAEKAQKLMYEKALNEYRTAASQASQRTMDRFGRDYGRARSTADFYNQAGRTPFTDAYMQQRLVARMLGLGQ